VAWWQIVLILLLIGLISIMVGILAGIPISKFVLRRKNQFSFGSYRLHPKFESRLGYSAPEHLNELPEKQEGTELQTMEPDREAAIGSEEEESRAGVEQAGLQAIEPGLIPVQSEDGEAELSLEQAEPQAREPAREATIGSGGGEAEVSGGETESSVIDRLLVELENNRELTIESNADKLMPFQTRVWDENRDVLDTISVNLQWELTQAYLDMVVANNIIWFLREFDRKSPDLDEQYTKMCKQIAARLDKIIPMLETARQAAA
jgi:hypothetical protein